MADRIGCVKTDPSAQISKIMHQSQMSARLGSFCCGNMVHWLGTFGNMGGASRTKLEVFMTKVADGPFACMTGEGRRAKAHADWH